MRKSIIATSIAIALLISCIPMSIAVDTNNNENRKAQFSDFNIALGNVPTECIPNSEITFGSEGVFAVTSVVKSIPAPESWNSSPGVEVGGNLAEQDPEAYAVRSANAQGVLESLPVYTYEDYYIAGEGAVAQYDQDGQLIRVRGEYKYFSTLDQYRVNGNLPSGTYIGNFGQFSTVVTRGVTTMYGKITTFGDKWPAISQSTYPNCNTDPVPNPPNGPSNYGDRIGTRNNKLYIGDVATRPDDNVAYGASLFVTIVAADTGYGSNITKMMYNKDKMGADTPILDIFRWDQPNWWTGTPAAPNDTYFNKKYSTTLSFPSTSNYWVYNY